MAIKVANNQSLTAITALPSAVSGGAMTLLETQTASSSATLSFTSGIDDTYDEYVFKFINIHPATNSQDLTFQVDTGTNTSYNQTITSTYFRSQHDESDTATAVGYRTSGDQAQGTAFQKLAEGQGADNDQSLSGEMYLFNPSSTTFVKHFMATLQGYRHNEYSANWFVAGYCNVTAAIDGVQFSMDSGNIDAGTFKLYGIKDS